jgi:hypothetical protein
MSNLELAIRSLFRLKLMKDRKYPQIVRDFELQILRKRLSELSVSERSFLEENKVQLIQARREEFERESQEIGAIIDE